MSGVKGERRNSDRGCWNLNQGSRETTEPEASKHSQSQRTRNAYLIRRRRLLPDRLRPRLLLHQGIHSRANRLLPKPPPPVRLHHLLLVIPQLPAGEVHLGRIPSKDNLPLPRHPLLVQLLHIPAVLPVIGPQVVLKLLPRQLARPPLGRRAGPCWHGAGRVRFDGFAADGVRWREGVLFAGFGAAAAHFFCGVDGDIRVGDKREWMSLVLEVDA
jgi:hypothetical protein